MQPKTYIVRHPEKNLEIKIRDIRMEEAPVLMEWMRSSDTAQTIASIYALSMSQEEDWLKKAYTDPNHFLMGVEFEGKLIGSWGAHFDGNSATTGSLIGIKDMRGKGIGSLAHMFRTWYLFTQIKDPRWKLKSAVLWDEGRNLKNFSSRIALEKSGYIQTGIMRGEYWRDGDLCDRIDLECYNPWFFKVQKYPELADSIKKVEEVIAFVKANVELV